MRKYRNGKKTAFGGTVARRERDNTNRRQTYARIRDSKHGKTVERFTALWPNYGSSLKVRFSDSDVDGVRDTITPSRRARSVGEYIEYTVTEIPQWIEWGTGTVNYINLTNNWSTYK